MVEIFLSTPTKSCFNKQNRRESNRMTAYADKFNNSYPQRERKNKPRLNYGVKGQICLRETIKQFSCGKYKTCNIHLQNPVTSCLPHLRANDFVGIAPGKVNTRFARASFSLERDKSHLFATIPSAFLKIPPRSKQVSAPTHPSSVLDLLS